MTPEIAAVLAILAGAVVLFVAEWLSVDLVALLVLASLALTGLVTPAEALSGFSSPAVITVWAIFILSGGLSRTGVANVIGRQMLRLAGGGEVGLIVVIMLTVGIMSAFMNNVGAAALLLPVVMDMARRTGRSPSKLLMPLAFGSLLGGLTTLIGTPPNILVSDALQKGGFPPFQLFDYTPVGLTVMVVGMAFMTFLGRYLLPVTDLTRGPTVGEKDYRGLYALSERLFVVRLPSESILEGRTLAECRLGSSLGLTVLGIIRDGQTRLAPGPGAVLQSGDRLLVEGGADRLSEFHGRRQFVLEEENLAVEELVSADVEIAEVELAPDSAFLGRTLRQIGFRHRFGLNVLTVWRRDRPKENDLQDTALHAGDILVVQGPPAQVDDLRGHADFIVSDAEGAELYHLHNRLFVVRVPEDSPLAGRTLADSRLGDAFGMTVMGIAREGATNVVVPEPSEQLQAGDTLLVEGELGDLSTIRGLQSLEVERGADPDIEDLESERIGLIEVVLSPHTTLAGRTLREIHFREKYGLNVLAIWREGRAYHANLRDVALRFGDALLLHGPRDRLRVLGREPDFLVLTEGVQEPLRLEKAPVAALVMGIVLAPVTLGWLPISIAAVVGAALMVLTGCLNMDEAYRFIEWRAVFLIAGMLPLGLAMEQSGAARLLADGMVEAVRGLGPLGVVAGLYVLTALTSQIMPNPVVVVLMAPIALSTAADLGLSPFALMMAIALSASASFMSPVSHPANVLIMGPGGYRFIDYVKVGLPLTLVVLAVVLLVLPIFWPLALVP